VIFLAVAYFTGKPLLVWRFIGIPSAIIFLIIIIGIIYTIYRYDNSWGFLVFAYYPWVGAISLYGIVYLLSELIRFGILFFLEILDFMVVLQLRLVENF
jgi:hypothetical protein